MWKVLTFASLAAQGVPFVLALRYGRRGKAVVYLATLPGIWFLALVVASAHFQYLPIIVLFTYPVVWAFFLREMQKHREQLRRDGVNSNSRAVG
jgi:hypothetical protein